VQKSLSIKSTRISELVEHQKNLADAIEKSSKAEREVLYDKFMAGREELVRYRGFDTGLNPQTKEHLALLETRSKKLQWESQNGPLGSLPDPSSNRYIGGNDQFNEVAYAMDLHQYHTRKRSFDGHVFGLFYF